MSQCRQDSFTGLIPNFIIDFFFQFGINTNLCQFWLVFNLKSVCLHNRTYNIYPSRIIGRQNLFGKQMILTLWWRPLRHVSGISCVKTLVASIPRAISVVAIVIVKSITNSTSIVFRAYTAIILKKVCMCNFQISVYLFVLLSICNLLSACPSVHLSIYVCPSVCLSFLLRRYSTLTIFIVFSVPQNFAFLFVL